MGAERSLERVTRCGLACRGEKEGSPAEDLSFEQAMYRLEEIVQQLERGQIPLEEALMLYAEGVELARRCNKILSEAEQKVITISAATSEAGEG